MFYFPDESIPAFLLLLIGGYASGAILVTLYLNDGTQQLVHWEETLLEIGDRITVDSSLIRYSERLLVPNRARGMLRV